MILNPTADQRAASERAANLVAQQAEGLRMTGSRTTVSALIDYVAPLRRIAAGGAVELSDRDKIALEQVTFVLEGLRDGLLTADFRDRANAVDADIHALNDIIAAYNAS
jgi:hypothetical protein